MTGVQTCALPICHYYYDSASAADIVEINVFLERDPHHPPFMRIAQPRDGVSSVLQGGGDADVARLPQKRNVPKFLNAAPKPSRTEMHVQELGYIENSNSDHRLPVTRVQLVPHTGRTHQLRVHTAALGYPIVGDDIYGYNGDGDCGAVTGDDRLDVQRQLYELELPLCLHAHRLSLFHPISGAPMVFECDPFMIF